MANINRVILVGNLTRDPELKTLPSGMSVCSLGIAVNHRRKNQQTGEWTEEPNYFNVEVFGTQGENCARYLAKGRAVAVDGRLRWRQWEAQDGSKRSAVDIIAETIQFIGPRRAARAERRHSSREPRPSPSRPRPPGTRRLPVGERRRDRRRHPLLIETMARTRTRKAILLVDVEHLGHRGEIVSVSRGFLRNYLLPRKLAEEASDARVAEVTRLRDQRAKQEARSFDQAQEIANVLNRTVLTIPARSGAEGRLYGSITTADLADEIWRTRKIRVDRRKIRLEEPIKLLGAYLVEIDVFPEVRASIKAQVVPAEGYDFDAEEAADRARRRLAVAVAVADDRDRTSAAPRPRRKGSRREHGALAHGPAPEHRRRGVRPRRRCCSRSARSSDVTEVIVDPGDFYREAHGTIFRAMQHLLARSEPLDAITVTSELAKLGVLDGRRRRGVRARADARRCRRPPTRASTRGSSTTSRSSAAS